MVGDEHDISGGEGGVHRAGGVGDDQRLCSQQPQHPDGIADIREGPALIGVETALHDGHVLAGQASKEKAALVVRGGGVLHVGDLVIGYRDGIFHLVAQSAQAGAQNQQDTGREAAQPGPQSLRTLLILRVGIGFHHSFPPHSRQNWSPS